MHFLPQKCNLCYESTQYLVLGTRACDQMVTIVETLHANPVYFVFLNTDNYNDYTNDNNKNDYDDRRSSNKRQKHQHQKQW